MGGVEGWVRPLNTLYHSTYAVAAAAGYGDGGGAGYGGGGRGGPLPPQ